MFEKKIKMTEQELFLLKDGFYKEIQQLKSEIEKLKIETSEYKNMYYAICNEKRIMDVLKVLDENDCPELTKQKLSKLWDVLPYYPPDWIIRKWIVKRRDGYICQKCGKDLFYCKEGSGQVHHIRPLSIGGTNEIKNLIFLCTECHKKIHNEMFNFSFSRDEHIVLYDDWTYYKIFRQDFKHFNNIDPAKKDCALPLDDTDLVEFATVYEPTKGIEMSVYTNMEGCQFYTGNFIKGAIGKNGRIYNSHDAFCLETQCFPDTPNKPDWPTCILQPGKVMKTKTIYSFGLKE